MVRNRGDRRGSDVTRFACPVAHWARVAPDALALGGDGGVRWTYRELDREAARWADWLARHGAAPGERVALIAGNHPATVAVLHALARLGAVAAPLNTRLTAAEVCPQVDRLEPSLVLADPAFADRVPGAHVLDAGRLDDPVPAKDSATAPLPTLDADAPHTILFTSGTTGVPRGATLSARCHQASALASALNLGGDAGQRWLGTLPLFHAGGLAMMQRCAWYGAALTLHPGFDADRVSAALDGDGLTHASLVPTTLARLLDARDGRPLPATLRAVLIGGAPAPAALLDRAAHPGVLHTYGLTEAASQVATERLGDRPDRRTSGVPLVGTTIRIVDDRRRRLPPGEAGEIEVRGPTIMTGYWREPEATARVLDADGWLRTGDLGELDAGGRLTVHARRVDLILSGGENVYPAEIEAVLVAHPAVADAAVVGIPDPEWGERPAAVLVGRAADRPADAELDAWCRARLAGFKIPRRWAWATELPRNAAGKTDRAGVKRLADRG